jgi:large subunit ribosomal protein L24e
MHSGRTGISYQSMPVLYCTLIFKSRMTIAREKKVAQRTKKLEAAKSSLKLVEPERMATEETRIREKIKVPKTRTALMQGEGRSMGMDID